jgi:alpha-L-fucosidase
MTINNTWGYKRDDEKWKSTETLIRNLCDIASKGGNYLLNVGPTSTGVIPQPEVERLLAVGQWMKVNGDAIYGTTATPFGAETGAYSDTEKDEAGKPKFIPEWNWRCTSGNGKIYVMIFNWPAEGKLMLPGLTNKVTKAFLLSDNKTVTFNQSNIGLTLNLPREAPDKIASVVCIEIADAVAKVS